MTLPWSTTTMWSARRSASSRYWVVSRTVVPAAVCASMVSPHPDPAARVQAGRRLVEEEDRRVGDERRGEIEPAGACRPSRSWPGAWPPRSAEALEQLVRAGARLRATQVVELADHLEVPRSRSGSRRRPRTGRRGRSSRAASPRRARRRARRCGRCRRRAREGLPGSALRWSCRPRWGRAGRGRCRCARRSQRHRGRAPDRTTSSRPSTTIASSFMSGKLAKAAGAFGLVGHTLGAAPTCDAEARRRAPAHAQQHPARPYQPAAARPAPA